MAHPVCAFALQYRRCASCGFSLALLNVKRVLTRWRTGSGHTNNVNRFYDFAVLEFFVISIDRLAFLIFFIVLTNINSLPIWTDVGFLFALTFLTDGFRIFDVSITFDIFTDLAVSTV